MKRRPIGVMAFCLGLVLAMVAVGCDTPRSSLRPSASLLEVEFTPQPTLRPESTDEPSDEPTFLSLPVGWDDAFCGVFADTVDAQELVIDIERAISEENAKDARGLARDLRNVTADATALLAELPPWEPAQPATEAITELITLGAQAGEAYGQGFTDQSRDAIRDARRLRRQIANKTPAANEALADLTAAGIACEGYDLKLEEF
jgi:hypothetical protein